MIYGISFSSDLANALVADLLKRYEKTPFELAHLHMIPRLLVGKYPDVGGDTGVVEDVVRELNDGLHQIAFHQMPTDVAFSAAGISGEE